VKNDPPVTLKKNLIANYLGQSWSALMGLVFIPFYIQYLGIEAYGLIGLFAVMQVWLTLLDVGMTPTLSREMARFTAGAHTPQSIRDLLRSIEIIAYSLAALIGLIVWAGSGWLASEWLKAENLSIPLRFCENLYRSALIGLQQQVWYNGANALLATLRHGGAVGLLAFVSPTIQAFFLWQAVISLLVLVTYASKLYRLLPDSSEIGRFSRSAIAGVWRFASGLLGISFLGILLTQVDKVLLSRLLTLEHYGYYTLAATVAGMLIMIIGPINQAIYPRMVELHTQSDFRALANVYHLGAQLVTVVTAPTALLLSIFSGGVIYLWSGDVTLSDNTAPILSPLAFGTFLNGIMWMPYQCQLAHGLTSLALKINVVAVTVLIPAILWIVPTYGGVGAAWIWVVLNAGYILIGIQFMHKRILPREKWRWYGADLILPAGGALGVMILAYTVQPTSGATRLEWALFLIFSGGLAFTASIVLASEIRLQLNTLLRNFRQVPESKKS
jgi:O-antigen/teichoic acid export membrane protein